MAENGLFSGISSANSKKAKQTVAFFLCGTSSTGINFRNSLKLAKGYGHLNRVTVNKVRAWWEGDNLNEGIRVF